MKELNDEAHGWGVVATSNHVYLIDRLTSAEPLIRLPPIRKRYV